MTPQQQVIFGIIVLALIGGPIIWMNTKLSKARKIAKEANIKCESMEEEVEELEKRNKGLNDQMDYIHSKTTCSDSQPLRYGMVKTNSFYDVFAVYKSINGISEVHILIKRFEFGDDPEFARLEAQELLDHLNEK